MANPRGRIFVAKESFAYVGDDGHMEMLKAGSRVREGHPILEGRETLFKVDDEILEVPEKAPAAARPAPKE